MELKKTIKVKANYLNEKDKENIQQVGKIQRNIKNYIWKRYGGISGLLKHSGWTIRDEIKEQNLYSKKIPQTLSKVAVEKGSGAIKTNWKNIRKDVRQAIMKNENLKEEDRIYLFTCLKHTPTLYAILNYKKVDYQNEYLKDLKVNVKKLNNLLRRYVRRYMKKSNTKKENIYLTSNLYDYSKKEKALYITSAKKNNRVKLELLGNVPNIISSIEVVFNNAKNCFFVHIPKTRIVKEKKKDKNSEIVGGDLGMTDLVTLSNGSVYGANSSELFYRFSDDLVNRNKSRIWSYKRELEEKLEKTTDKKEKILLTNKINNLIENNLGNKKAKAKTKRYKTRVVAHINHELNEMIKNENIKQFIREDLTWSSKKKFGTSKKQQNRFTTWCKGILVERLSIKLEEAKIKESIVNAAYTSQVCSKCNHLGHRTNKLFTCPNCHLKIDADFNAAINIKKRLRLTEITIYTKFYKVKEYYINLFKPKNIKPV